MADKVGGDGRRETTGAIWYLAFTRSPNGTQPSKAWQAVTNCGAIGIRLMNDGAKAPQCPGKPPSDE